MSNYRRPSSNDRHYCKLCNTWMAGDKMSIRVHENGSKHKEKVMESVKTKREGKADKERDEKELAKQLDDIENAAREAISQDRENGQMSFYSVPPPPPQQQQSEQEHQYQAQVLDNHGTATMSKKENEHVKKEPEIETKKINRKAEKRVPASLEQLDSGTTCELYFENIDQWKPGVISIVNDDESFDVTYFEGADGSMIPEMESSVKIDRLRLVIEVEDVVESNQKEELKGAKNVEKLAPVVESTGLGGWQTVSVREVNDEEELKLQAERARALDIERERSKQKHASKNLDNNAKATRLNEDVMVGSNDEDLYEANVYRGVEVNSVKTTALLESEMNSLAGGQNVVFKKRKKMTVSKVKKEENHEDQDMIRQLAAIANKDRKTENAIGSNSIKEEKVEIRKEEEEEEEVVEIKGEPTLAVAKKVTMTLGKKGLKRKIQME